jgi:hypothetical protein
MSATGKERAKWLMKKEHVIAAAVLSEFGDPEVPSKMATVCPWS